MNKFWAYVASAARFVGGAPAFSHTVCNQRALAGNWLVGLNALTSCSVRIRNTGTIRGTCSAGTFDGLGNEIFEIRGRLTLDETCLLSGFVRDGEGSRLRLTGRVMGTASTTPDAGMVVFRTGARQTPLSGVLVRE